MKNINELNKYEYYSDHIDRRQIGTHRGERKISIPTGKLLEVIFAAIVTEFSLAPATALR